jgi:hypothetical protein
MDLERKRSDLEKAKTKQVAPFCPLKSSDACGLGALRRVCFCGWQDGEANPVDTKAQLAANKTKKSPDC